MELIDFFEKIESHDSLQGVGIDGEQLIIKNIRTGSACSLPAGSIEAADWDLLEAVLIGSQSPEVLRHMTRVVGYYSRVENWNKSKVGELKDRQRGNYTLE